MTVFWDIALRSLVETDRRFRRGWRNGINSDLVYKLSPLIGAFISLNETAFSSVSNANKESRSTVTPICLQIYSTVVDPVLTS
jgi:hypothetical protein